MGQRQLRILSIENDPKQTNRHWHAESIRRLNLRLVDASPSVLDPDRRIARVWIRRATDHRERAPNGRASRTLEFRMLSKKILFWVALTLFLGALSAKAQDTSRAVTLFNNVRIFDGRSPALSAPSNVLI